MMDLSSPTLTVVAAACNMICYNLLVREQVQLEGTQLTEIINQTFYD